MNLNCSCPYLTFGKVFHTFKSVAGCKVSSIVSQWNISQTKCPLPSPLSAGGPEKTVKTVTSCQAEIKYLEEA